MISEDLNKHTTEEFNKLVKIFDKRIIKYAKENIINDFVAYYISTAFDLNDIRSNELKTIAKCAIEDLSLLKDENCNLDEVKSILLNKYKLKVIQDKPVIIEEIK